MLQNRKESITIIIFILLLVLSRIIVEIPNFTPTVALIMFASVLLKDKLSFIVCVIFSQIISDAYLGFYDGMLFTYLAYLIIGFATSGLVKELKFSKILFMAVVSPVLFFLITNFGEVICKICINSTKHIIRCRILFHHTIHIILNVFYYIIIHGKKSFCIVD